MERGHFPDAASILLGFIAGVLIFTVLVVSLSTDYQAEAIKRGYAIHNATTGVWEWVEPKKVEPKKVEPKKVEAEKP